ncbi:MAG: alpha/beta hydrolase-fold protein, partial [Myxococcota bacterium]
MRRLASFVLLAGCGDPDGLPGTCMDVVIEDQTVATGFRERLFGEAFRSCEGEYGVDVLIDSNPVEGNASVDGPLDGVGSWEANAKLWCHEKEFGPLAGEHAVTVASYALDAPDDVLMTSTAMVDFSGAEADHPEIPWDARENPPPGADPANSTGAVERRIHEVDVTVEGTDTVYPYVVDLPSGYDPGAPAPVLISLHGWGSDDAHLTFAAFQGWSTDLDARGIIHVLPKGNWYDPEASELSDPNPRGSFGCLESVGQCNAAENWYTPVLTAILTDLIGRYSIQSDQVYLDGFSCGASYAYCLGTTFPEKFAAVAIMDGNQAPIADDLYAPKNTSRRVPLFIVGGAAGPEWEAAFGGGS